MRPQLQEPEIFDCLRTCVATIFDQDRLDVPNFGYMAVELGFASDSLTYAHRQTNEFEEWCLDHGIYQFKMLVNAEGFPRPQSPWGICVAHGPGPRGLPHGVVWDAKWWKNQNKDYGEMIHDPHPSGDGLLKVEMWTCFVPMTTPKLVEKSKSVILDNNVYSMSRYLNDCCPDCGQYAPDMGNCPKCGAGIIQDGA